APQALDDGDGAVVGILHPKDHLHASCVVLGAERGEIFVQPLLVAVQRLEDGDVRRGRRTRAGTVAGEAPDQDYGREEIAAAGGCDHRGRDRRPEQEHVPAQWSGWMDSRGRCARSAYFGTRRPHSSICQPTRPGTPSATSAARLTSDNAIACSGGIPKIA